MTMFSLFHNGQPLPAGADVVAAGELSGVVNPFKKWADPIAYRQGAKSATLEVFKIPIDSFRPWDEELQVRDGEIVDLGIIASCVASGRDFSIQTEPGNIYDIFCAARDEDGNGAAFVPNRFVTGAEIPEGYTLDELQFVALVGLGMNQRQASGVYARLGQRVVNSYMGRSMIVAGFNLELNTPGADNELGVMVGPDASFTRFRYLSEQQTRELAGIVL